MIRVRKECEGRRLMRDVVSGMWECVEGWAGGEGQMFGWGSLFMEQLDSFSFFTYI